MSFRAEPLSEVLSCDEIDPESFRRPSAWKISQTLNSKI